MSNKNKKAAPAPEPTAAELSQKAAEKKKLEDHAIATACEKEIAAVLQKHGCAVAGTFSFTDGEQRPRFGYKIVRIK